MKLSSRKFYYVKMIACFTMFLDHLAYCLFEVLPIVIFYLFRVIGRFSAPCFLVCLLLSFYHTQDKQEHLSRMFLIACLSEPLYFTVFGFGHHNIIFTLMLIWFCLMVCDNFVRYVLLMIMALLSYYLHFDSWYICIFAVPFDLFFHYGFLPADQDQVNKCMIYLTRYFYPLHLLVLSLIF